MDKTVLWNQFTFSESSNKVSSLSFDLVWMRHTILPVGFKIFWITENQFFRTDQ